jgi:hypothetical protein
MFGKQFPLTEYNSHLDQGSQAVLPERVLQIANGFDLCGPETFHVSRWHVLHTAEEHFATHQIFRRLTSGKVFPGSQHSASVSWR